MNKLARRAIAALVLAAILATGALVIVVKYFVNGSDWVTFQSSPHVYSNGVLDSGVIEQLTHGDECHDDELRI